PDLVDGNSGLLDGGATHVVAFAVLHELGSLLLQVELPLLGPALLVLPQHLVDAAGEQESGCCLVLESTTLLVDDLDHDVTFGRLPVVGDVAHHHVGEQVGSRYRLLPLLRVAAGTLEGIDCPDLTGHGLLVEAQLGELGFQVFVSDVDIREAVPRHESEQSLLADSRSISFQGVGVSHYSFPSSSSRSSFNSSSRRSVQS